MRNLALLLPASVPPFPTAALASAFRAGNADGGRLGAPDSGTECLDTGTGSPVFK